MKIRSFGVEHLAGGEDFRLDFGEEKNGLYLIYGPNEAGKSTLLQALLDWLFGGKIEGSWKGRYISRSKLSGVIEDGESRPLRLVRKKKYSQLVLDEEESDVTEERIFQLLNGYDKEKFSLLFGFDHERLRNGGESLLQSGGQAGISLFETGSGLAFLQNLVKELSDRSSALLDPRFPSNSKKAVNLAYRAFTDAERAVRASAIRGEDWHRLKNEKEAAAKKIGELERKINALKREKEKLERVNRVHKSFRKLWELRERLDKLAGCPVLSEDLDEQILQTIKERKKIAEKIEALKGELRQKEEEIKLLRQDPLVLQMESEIESLYEGLKQYITRLREEIPNEVSQREAKERELVSLLDSLAPGMALESASALRIPFAEEEKILALAEAAETARAQHDRILERFAEIRADREKAVAELKALGEPKDVSVLERLVREIREKGDLEAALSKKKEEIERKRAELDALLHAQSLWRGPWEELEKLPVPLMETIDRFQNRWEDLEKELEKLQGELEKLRQDQEEIDFSLKRLELDGPVPTEAELTEARAFRDTGWRLIRREWLEGGVAPEEVRAFAGERSLPEAFEKSVEEADRIADLLRKESARTAQRAQFLLQKEKNGREIERLEGQIKEKQAAFASLREAWQKEWAAAGIDPKSPAEMKGWLVHFLTPMQAGWKDWKRAEQEYAKSVAEVQEDLARLVSAASPFRRTAEPRELKPFLAECEKIIRDEEEKRRKIENAKEKLRDSDEKLKACQEKLDEAEARLKQLAGEWADMREKFPHLPEGTEIAAKYIGKLRELFGSLLELEKIEASLAKKRAYCQTFEEEAAALAEKLGEPFASPETFIRQAYQRLSEAKEGFVRRQSMETERKRLELALHQAKEEEKARRSQIDGFKKEYGCGSEEALIVLVEKSRAYKSLDQSRSEQEQLIREAGDHLPLEQLEREVKETENPEGLADEIGKLGDECGRLEKILQEERERYWDLAKAFDQLDGSQTDAVKNAQEAEAHWAEVDRYWNEYLRVELAKRLLEREIERFREQNESPVIERASRFFSRLTLGRYEGLSVEYEGTEPYIEAVDGDGTRRRVAELSDGTRDQLYLSLRLAFIDRHLEENGPLPLIFDDIFVNFDDDRTKAALEVLHGLSEKTQLIYFTHHRSVLEIAGQMEDTRRLRAYDLPAYKEAALK